MSELSTTSINAGTRVVPSQGALARLRQTSLSAGAAVLSLFVVADGLLAQDGAAPPDPGETSNVVVTQPFPYGGLLLLIVMVGLSLFAVCRSSRRN